MANRRIDISSGLSEDEFAFLRALNALKTQEGIYDYKILDRTHDLYSISPIPNIKKIDLDPSKTVILKCLEGLC